MPFSSQVFNEIFKINWIANNKFFTTLKDRGGQITLSKCSAVFWTRFFPGFEFPMLLHPQEDENLRVEDNSRTKVCFFFKKKIIFLKYFWNCLNYFLKIKHFRTDKKWISVQNLYFPYIFSHFCGSNSKKICISYTIFCPSLHKNLGLPPK